MNGDGQLFEIEMNKLIFILNNAMSVKGRKRKETACEKRKKTKWKASGKRFPKDKIKKYDKIKRYSSI